MPEFPATKPQADGEKASLGQPNWYGAAHILAR